MSGEGGEHPKAKHEREEGEEGAASVKEIS